MLYSTRKAAVIIILAIANAGIYMIDAEPCTKPFVVNDTANSHDTITIHGNSLVVGSQVHTFEPVVLTYILQEVDLKAGYICHFGTYAVSPGTVIFQIFKPLPKTGYWKLQSWLVKKINGPGIVEVPVNWYNHIKLDGNEKLGFSCGYGCPIAFKLGLFPFVGYHSVLKEDFTLVEGMSINLPLLTKMYKFSIHIKVATHPTLCSSYNKYITSPCEDLIATTTKQDLNSTLISTATRTLFPTTQMTIFAPVTTSKPGTPLTINPLCAKIIDKYGPLYETSQEFNVGNPTKNGNVLPQTSGYTAYVIEFYELPPGYVCKFNVFFVRSGTIWLQIWRKMFSQSYKLIYEIEHEADVPVKGIVNTVYADWSDLEKNPLIQKDDLIGFITRGSGMIAFTLSGHSQGRVVAYERLDVRPRIDDTVKVNSLLVYQFSINVTIASHPTLCPTYPIPSVCHFHKEPEPTTTLPPPCVTEAPPTYEPKPNNTIVLDIGATPIVGLTSTSGGYFVNILEDHRLPDNMFVCAFEAFIADTYPVRFQIWKDINLQPTIRSRKLMGEIQYSPSVGSAGKVHTVSADFRYPIRTSKDDRIGFAQLRKAAISFKFGFSIVYYRAFSSLSALPKVGEVVYVVSSVFGYTYSLRVNLANHPLNCPNYKPVVPTPCPVIEYNYVKQTGYRIMEAVADKLSGYNTYVMLGYNLTSSELCHFDAYIMTPLVATRFQIWRPVSEYRYYLVDQVSYTADEQGLAKVLPKWEQTIKIQDGDRIGFTTEGQATIPWAPINKASLFEKVVAIASHKSVNELPVVGAETILSNVVLPLVFPIIVHTADSQTNCPDLPLSTTSPETTSIAKDTSNRISNRGFLPRSLTKPKYIGNPANYGKVEMRPGNAGYILLKQSSPTDGYIHRFNVYLIKHEPIHLQMWRLIPRNIWQLIASVTFKSLGRAMTYTVYPLKAMKVLKGDVLGFSTSGSSPLTYNVSMTPTDDSKVAVLNQPSVIKTQEYASVLEYTDDKIYPINVEINDNDLMSKSVPNSESTAKEYTKPPQPPGPVGPIGEQGPQGPSGPPGKPGKSGLPGKSGSSGKKGPKGLKGDTGDQGLKGLPGNVGDYGPTGKIGKPGEQGKPGNAGAQGIPGLPGEPGPAAKTMGQPGKPGLKGNRGVVGPVGAPGIKGPQGETGLPGEIGLQGENGTVGDIAYKNCLTKNGDCEQVCTDLYPSVVCSCYAGHETSFGGNGPCIEINGCLEKNGGCHGLCIHNVDNHGTIKAHKARSCMCSEGFTLSANGFSCNDINECELEDGACKHGQICLNTEGSFECYDLTSWIPVMKRSMTSGQKYVTVRMLVGLIAWQMTISLMILLLIAYMYWQGKQPTRVYLAPSRHYKPLPRGWLDLQYNRLSEESSPPKRHLTRSPLTTVGYRVPSPTSRNVTFTSNSNSVN